MDWDAARRKVLALHARVERQVDSLGEAGDNLRKQQDGFAPVERSSPTHMIGRSSQVAVDNIETCRELLRSLAEAVTSLREHPESQSPGQKQMSARRYADSAYELTGRFSRASDSMKRLLEHRDLLAGASRSGHDEEVEHALLRERGGIQEAGRAIAEMAGQAIEGQEALDRQGQGLGTSLSGFEQIASQLPGVGRLLRAIRDRRQRDSLIVAVVVGFCLCLFLYLLFRKLGI